ncbi:MAG: DUF4135 domain-containing protein [Holophagales bacterium]|nr:DUF4135 domain-containing protein [Holophagales bacterium]
MARALAPDAVPRSDGGAPWPRLTDEALHEAASLDPDPEVWGAAAAMRDRALDPARVAPHEGIVLPWVRAARRRLDAALAASGSGRLDPAARASIENGWLRLLSHVAAPTLQREFANFRACRRSALAEIVERARTPPSRRLYGAFVGRMLRGGLTDLLRRFPELGRLLGAVALHQVGAVARMLAHLEADALELGRLLGTGGDPGKVLGAEGYLGDRHRGGRSVYELRFAAGRCSYKPRSLALDAAFFEVLGACEALASGDPEPLPLPRRRPAILDRGDHGWMEWLENRRARSGDDDGEGGGDDRRAVELARRCGALTALAHCLAAVDLHAENLLVVGEDPVPIDLETLCHSRLAGTPALEGRKDSVLRTGLLPAGESGNDDAMAPFAPAAVVSRSMASPAVATEARWQHLHTDAMELRPLPPLPPGEPRVLVMPAQSEAFEAGFRRTARFLHQHRRTLLARGGPIERLAHCPSRFLLRPSRVYGALLRRSIEPEHLRSAEHHRRCFEVLHRAATEEAQGALVDAEIHALSNFDLPRLETLPGSDHLSLDNGIRVPGALAEPGLALVRRRLEGLDEREVERQVTWMGYL